MIFHWLIISISIIFLISKFQSKIIEVKTYGNQTIVPVAGDIVTARVTVINQRFVKCSIICIGDVVLKRVYRGILRKEDVRAERKDDVDMYKSFRPGDIILARIVSICVDFTNFIDCAKHHIMLFKRIYFNVNDFFPVTTE